MKPRLLVLDDQVLYLRSLERSLRADHEVVLASGLTEAKDKLADTPSLVLTDIRLREDDPDDRQGLEFIRFVRSRYPQIPIVAMSALDAPDLQREALSCGAVTFLRKPIVVSELRSLLARLLAAGR